MVAASVAAILASSVALALVTDTGTYNIEVADKSISSPLVQLTATPGDGSGFVKYIGSSAQDQASGTGLFDPFVRLQGSLETAPTETGYNTCSQQNPCGGDVTEFETKPGSWTHAIKASAIPVVDCDTDGDPQTTEHCWELFVDINEGNNAKYISLTKVEIYFTDNADGTITDYPFGAEATLQYQFTGEIKIHDVNQGSGRGDLLYLVPVQPFDSSDWFVLYSEWGSLDASPDNKTYASEGGFEEWKVRKTPNVSIVKTADAASVSAGQNIGFTITVTNNGVADATGVTISDPLPAGSGIDWAESPDNPDCAIAGVPPNETLNCGPVTLAAEGGSLSVHVQSTTTAASCGTYNNTATFTSTNAGSGSASASTVVQCGALMIVKQSTKSGNPLVATAGAVFSVDGPDANSDPDFSVTDDTTVAAPDEDASIGEVCVSGLVPGSYTINETTAPPGYGDASQTNVAVTVVNGTSCTAGSLPGAGATATFTNPPLADILVRVDGQSSGEIASSISCVDSGSNSIGSVGVPTPVDPAILDVDDLPPGTYTCTLVIDP